MASTAVVRKIHITVVISEQLLNDVSLANIILRIRCLLKIHYHSIPLRTVVSFINSQLYDLAN